VCRAYCGTLWLDIVLGGNPFPSTIFRFTETAFVFLFFIAFPISRMREATRIFSFKPYAVSILQENSQQAVTRCMV
jgi:hypothetical protein